MNCVVWLQSRLPSEEILEKCLAIEKKMGRERTPTEGYASRPIDIDIILIEDQKIATSRLTVPHPEMQHRKHPA